MNLCLDGPLRQRCHMRPALRNQTETTNTTSSSSGRSGNLHGTVSKHESKNHSLDKAAWLSDMQMGLNKQHYLQKLANTRLKGSTSMYIYICIPNMNAIKNYYNKLPHACYCTAASRCKHRNAQWHGKNKIKSTLYVLLGLCPLLDRILCLT